jgi:hypothetical protein
MLLLCLGKWSREQSCSSLGAVEQICGFNHRLLRLSIWQHFVVDIHSRGLYLLDHPAYDPNGPHFYKYNDAIIDSSTASYVEAETILNTIQAVHIDGIENRFKNMFVVGDQQLYDRMCVLVTRQPEQYSWVIPLDGDFHFTGHMVGWMNDFYYLNISGKIASALGFDKVVKHKDDNITHFKHYDHFYLLLTLGLVMFLSETLDAAVMASPEILLGQMMANEGKFIHCIFAFRSY